MLISIALPSSTTVLRKIARLVETTSSMTVEENPGTRKPHDNLPIPPFWDVPCWNDVLSVSIVDYDFLLFNVT